MTLAMNGPGETYVKVIADSVSAHTGDRVTSFEMNVHRMILAEVNTFGLAVRNSASSRAIPVDKQLARFEKTPAFPISWPCEQKGMSGGAELEGEDYFDALALFEAIHRYTWKSVSNYVGFHPDKEHRLHKSLLNRLLEWGQYHKVLLSASSFGNFYTQRCDPAAQPEFRVIAEMMRELQGKSDPVELVRGQWHLPYLKEGEAEEIKAAGYDAREISSARAARTSYMTQDGVRDFVEDVRLYSDLVSKNHWSPLAHVCTPDKKNVQMVEIRDPDTGEQIAERRVTVMGQFIGFQQWRHVVEGRMDYVSQR